MLVKATDSISFPEYLGFSQSANASSGRITGIRSWIMAMSSDGERVRIVNTG